MTAIEGVGRPATSRIGGRAASGARLSLLRSERGYEQRCASPLLSRALFPT